MRLLLVVLALALMSLPQPTDAHIQRGKAYLYDYEATLMSGVPNAGFNRAGVKIHAKVEVIGLDHREALITVHQPEVLQYLDRWPGGEFSPISPSAEPLIREIQVPVKFKFDESSLVTAVFAPSDVSEEALNIIRAIINFFNFSYKKDKPLLKGQEDGLGGVCHTSYVVQEQGTSKKTVVSKTRDLGNCQQKIYTTTGAAYTETCPGCRMHLRSTATYTYTLTDSEPQVIQDVEADEIHQFSPFFETEGSIVTQGRYGRCGSGRGLNKDIPGKNTRTFVPCRIWQTSRGAFVSLLQTEANPDQFGKGISRCPIDTLRHLVENNQMEVHYDAPAKFMELAMMMRHMDSKQLDSLWRKIHSQKDYRRWVLDAVPAMATSEALSFVVQAVTSNYLTESEASSVLLSILHLVKVNITAIRDAKTLMDSPFVRASPSIRKSVTLAYGSMVNRFCAKTPVCKEEVPPLHSLLAESSRKSLPHHSETILALKAIGNAGQPSSIRRILKYLPLKGKNMDSSLQIIQITAISALSAIAKKDPASVKQRALQLFLDSTLVPELRIRAFSILMETRPSFVTLALVAEKLKSEKNLQVASFTTSYIHAVRRSSVPELRNMSMACNIIAKTVGSRFDKLGARYSKVFHTSIFKEKLNAGVMANLFVFNSGDSFIPKGIVAKVRGFAGGVAADIVEVMFSSYLMETRIRSTVVCEIVLFVKYWFELPSPALHSFVSSLERGINALYTKALLGSEIRYMQPTSAGMLLDVSLYLSSVITSRADGKLHGLSPLPFWISYLQKTAEEPIAVALAKVIREDRRPHGLQLAVYGPSSAPQTGLPSASIVVSDLNASSSWKLCAKVQALTPSKARVRPSTRKWKQSTDSVVLRLLGRMPRVWEIGGLKPGCLLKGLMMVRAASLLDGLHGFLLQWSSFSGNSYSILISFLVQRNVIIYCTASSWLEPCPPLYCSLTTATCTAIGKNFTTFNKREYNYSMPKSCKHILLQDCKENSAFAVYLKNISSGDYELQMITKDRCFVVLSFLFPNNCSIVFLFFFTLLANIMEGVGWRFFFSEVTVNNKLMGSVCGLCGHNDGEMMNDLKMPNHNISNDPEVFGYSWALPDASCDGCEYNLKRGIKRENGEVETCYSKHSILRCPANCTPVDTISVKLGMHCLPPGDMANSSSLSTKSEDTQSVVQAHTLCECDHQSCKTE
uniref:Vitellogenin n=1 Tax=Eptatretus burgeri TaxID=7764 RepID=A0A8C4NAS7_EPTBU